MVPGNNLYGCNPNMHLDYRKKKDDKESKKEIFLEIYFY